MSHALLFPGQGAQKPDMLSFLRKEPMVQELVRDLNEACGLTPEQLDSIQALKQPMFLQLALFLAGVASFQILMERGARIDLIAGFSVGTFSAAVASGAYTFRDLLPIVALRATLMEAAYPSGYGMLALVGDRTAQLARWAEEDPGLKGSVFLATVNSVNQIVFAGALPLLATVGEEARRIGFTGVHYLDVPTPSHCPLLLSVSEKLAIALAKVSVSTPRMGYLSNSTTRIVSDAASIRFDLQTNVSRKIHWLHATELMLESRNVNLCRGVALLMCSRSWAKPECPSQMSAIDRFKRWASAFQQPHSRIQPRVHAGRWCNPYHRCVDLCTGFNATCLSTHSERAQTHK